MLRVNRLFTILLLVALILSACQPITRPPAPEPQPPQGLRPDAPAYAVRGPYVVGVRNFKIEATKDNQRPLTVSVWYPALNPNGVEESVIYEMGFSAGETPNFAVYGYGINDSGQLVGCSPTVWGDIHAFRWTLTEGMVDLGELDGDWHVFD